MLKKRLARGGIALVVLVTWRFCKLAVKNLLSQNVVYWRIRELVHSSISCLGCVVMLSAFARSTALAYFTKLIDRVVILE